ncbi:MAG: glycosyltransferase [Candidatus Scalinduaceae bacterium]
MKLICVSPGYWPAFRHGGPIFSVHGLNKVLVKMGVDVTVYATNSSLNGEVTINEEVNVDGVKVIYFGFIKSLEFLGRMGWQFSWQMTKALKRDLKKFDLIHIQSVWNYPTTAATYYCKKYDKPYIISTRGTLYPYTIMKKSWKKLPYYYLVAKRDLKGASVIHYTTEDEAEKCHSFLGLNNQAIIIPNGIDLSEYNDLPTKESLKRCYPILKDKKVILFLSRIHQKKGLDILSKAYGKLARQRKDVHLLIVGFGEEGYEKKVRRWFEEEGVLEQVTFTGMLKGKEKLEAFAGSDIFVLPSYSENFGMAVIEAMASGLPVIISNQVGIHNEIAEAKAGRVIETDAEQLAEAMANLLDNPVTCKEMGENGLKLVKEQFNLDEIAEQMAKAYENIVKG